VPCFEGARKSLCAQDVETFDIDKDKSCFERRVVVVVAGEEDG
jgi:hypothetical protein